MPKGPHGEKCPADVIGMSVKVMRIATGEETEELDRAKSAALWYNFVRIHKTLRVTPATAAGIADRLWSMEDVVAMIDARSAKITGETLVG